MPGILTRKIGPFPGWAWAAIAGGGFLVFLYMRSRRQGRPTPVAIPQFASASGTIPYVPTSATTGAPPGPSLPPGAGKTQLSVRSPQSGGVTANYDAANSGPPVRTSAGPTATIGTVPFGSVVTATGPVQPGAPNELGNPMWWPISFGGGVGFLNAGDVAGSVTGGGGSGGFGYAGTPGLATPIGGWTVGWQPFGAGGGRGDASDGSGGPATVNRTGARATRPRRLYGGAGGGRGGSQVINRRRATRSIRSRSSEN